jgi:hypothetical protein
MLAAVERAPEQPADSDFVVLPSGAKVDLKNVNVRACRTQEDAFELMQCLQEKMISIDYQLECYSLGYWPDGRQIKQDDKPEPLWLPRAKQAMAYAKMHKADAQNRLQRIAKAENLERYQRRERVFMDIAADILDEGTFSQIMKAVTLRCGVAPSERD